MQVSSKKNKGKRLEHYVAELLKEFNLDPYAYRRADSGSGIKKEDVTVHEIPIWIECKNQETWKIIEWYKDAKSKNKNPDVLTLLFLGRNRIKMPLVFFSWDDYIVLQDYTIGDNPFQIKYGTLTKQRCDLQKEFDRHYELVSDQDGVFVLGWGNFAVMYADDLCKLMKHAQVNGWYNLPTSVPKTSPNTLKYKEVSRNLGRNTWAKNQKKKYNDKKAEKDSAISSYQNEVFNLLNL